MPSSDGLSKALAMVTIAVTGDRAARDLDLGWEGGCPEALGSMIRLSEGLVKLLAETQGVTPEVVVQELALAIAGWDD